MDHQCETLAPSKFQVVKKIVLKPKTENAVPPVFNYDTEFMDAYSRDGFSYREPLYSLMSITNIDPEQWTVSFKVGPTEKFEKVAEIVGEEKAAKVLEALGL